MLLILIAITQNANTQSPTGKIQGKITDENNTALPGASVFISALSIGTVSDLNGIFELSDINSFQASITTGWITNMSHKRTASTGNMKQVESFLFELKDVKK